MANPPDRTWDVPQSQPNLPASMPPATTFAAGSTIVNPYKWPLQSASGQPAGQGPQTPPMGPTSFINITNASPLPGGTHAVVYTNYQFNGSGGTTPYSFTATGVPAGMTLSAAGVLGGTPTAAGTSTIVVTMTDAATPAHTVTKSFSITIA